MSAVWCLGLFLHAGSAANLALDCEVICGNKICCPKMKPSLDVGIPTVQRGACGNTTYGHHLSIPLNVFDPLRVKTANDWFGPCQASKRIGGCIQQLPTYECIWYHKYLQYPHHRTQF